MVFVLNVELWTSSIPLAVSSRVCIYIQYIQNCIHKNNFSYIVTKKKSNSLGNFGAAEKAFLTQTHRVNETVMRYIDTVIVILSKNRIMN